MALLVWFMTGIALWHFTVFLPDRFWQGIVGAFLGAVFGAIFSGAVAQIAIGSGIGETDLATVLYALPGTMLGLAVIWVIGARSERTLTD
jgi:outer membrane lipoprotein SlyB